MLTNLLEASKDWVGWLDKGDAVDVIFLDMTRAFDVMPHDKLINKLVQLNVNPLVINWIAGYLTSRSQVVRVGDVYSDEACVTSGVPQGSIIGPTLFKIFVSDVHLNLRSGNKLLADDIKVYNTAANSSVLQADLNILARWSVSNGVAFNPTKCVVLRMHRSFKHSVKVDYTLNDTVLSNVESARDLGVIHDAQLYAIIKTPRH